MRFNIRNKKTEKVLEWVVLMLLLGILSICLYTMVRNFEVSRQRGYFRALRGRQETLGSSFAVEPWMTMRYINAVFKLSPEYLKTQLNIQDSRYPNISVSALAKEQKLSIAQMSIKISAALKSFGGGVNFKPQ